MIKNNLKAYFPMIQTRMKIMDIINSEPRLKTKYESWNQEQREKFLDFMTGARGVKVLYDAFFKLVMNHEKDPKRLNTFFSLVLRQKVSVKEILPLESIHIGDDAALIIMDVVVQLEDGSIANLEVQKMGHFFPGQRAACYSADLLLRQYKRVRDTYSITMENAKNRKKKRFSYREIKNVYTIILIESSISEFHCFPSDYRHYFKQQSDTGIELPLLQEYCFISLDIFKEILHNKGITNELEAWLTFFCEDDPELIIKLLEDYPYFKTMYEEIYQKCLDIEEVMGMFSEELAELDRNTISLVFDEMQEEVEAKRKELKNVESELANKKEEITQQKEEITQQKEEITQQKEEITQQKEEITQQKEEITQQKEEIIQQKEEIIQQRKAIAAMDARIAELEVLLKAQQN